MAEICNGDSIFLQGYFRKTAGNYYDTLISSNGCDSVLITSLSVNSKPGISFTSTDVSCSNGSDGTASATPSGGISPYSYLWSIMQTTPAITGLVAGNYSVTVSDSKGCSSVKTVIIDQSFLIHNYPEIYNPSFEEMDYCPASFSQLKKAKGWNQPNQTTSDYMNTCGFMFEAATTAGLVPFPDGDGIAGTIYSPGWMEYIGTCLTQPLIAGNSYTLNFSIASTPIDNSGNTCNGGIIDYGPIDITIFGNANCIDYSFSGSECPAGTGSGSDPSYTVVTSQSYTPSKLWEPFSLTFTPAENIKTIVIGSPCTLPASYTTTSGCYPYFYYDNFLLNFSDNITTICDGDSVFLQGNYQKVAGTYYDTLVATNGCDSMLKQFSISIQHPVFRIQYQYAMATVFS